MTISVAIVGATGKMGLLAGEVIAESSDFVVTAHLNSSSDFAEMRDGDLVFDLSTPEVSPRVVDYALAHNKNVLIGTSGWSLAKLAPIEHQLSEQKGLGVTVIPNFSLGSVLATHFATQAARFFDAVEIVEAHHAAKRDFPSGTAIRTAERISDIYGRTSAAQPSESAAENDNSRAQFVGGVPIHSIRLPGVLARQDIIFGGVGETLTISHDTTDRRSYAAGILLALSAAHSGVGLRIGLDSLLGLS